MEDVALVFYPLPTTRDSLKAPVLVAFFDLFVPPSLLLHHLLFFCQSGARAPPRLASIEKDLNRNRRGEGAILRVMMNVLSSHPQNMKLRIQEISHSHRRRSCRVQCPYALDSPCGGAGGHVALVHPRRRRHPFVAVRAANGSGGESSSGEDDDDQEKQSKKEGSSGSGLSREDLERLVGPDDATFDGLDLANLIRKKYGRSYDVTLIKKEFMGRNLLAMNVMWKYREQVSGFHFDPLIQFPPIHLLNSYRSR
ncbi:uncharacterized protein LOC133920164 isoform X2 [Phragmites australis]|uniref:uncharacterized protein LOC133920164 isoform X2 n=1 Tax=Phragmites australis TaxID=29695 RepID=UPI002D765945|nr:uncharacterized protein LOC133920164 isoform X2 [Phragmites australis]